MKARVRLTYSVELFVEGESEEVIVEWLNCTTPEEAKELVKDRYIPEDYSEQIICVIKDDSAVDYVIG